MSKVSNVIRFALVASVGVSASAWEAATAQDSSTYYTVMHPEEFEIDWGAFYREAERRTAALRERLPHHLDLAYGDDPKQRLDLYLPEGEVGGAPVFLFLHGGGFREGDRAQYGFVAEPFAAHGIITAVASYRLTEAGHHYPAQPEDARAAVAWLYRHVAEYGGDREAIWVGGHSAGAILAADLGVDRAWMAERDIPESALRGIVPISGPYDLRERGRPGEVNAYAPTSELQAQASPILKVGRATPAVLVAVGSTEERFLETSEELVRTMEEHGTKATLLVLPGEDHKDTVLSLADPASRLFRSTLNMIAAGR
jgi:arylformamidase